MSKKKKQEIKKIMNKTVYPNYTILRSVTIIYVDIMKKIDRCLYNRFNRPTYNIKF